MRPHVIVNKKSVPSDINVLFANHFPYLHSLPEYVNFYISKS